MTSPHGGDMDAVSREFKMPIAGLLDFSASINPLGPPAAVLARLRRESCDASLLERYPDPAHTELRSTLAAQLDVPPACVTVANGSAALVGATIRAVARGTCLLPVPAFSEQPRALEAAGCAIERFSLNVADGFRLDPNALCEAMERVRPAACMLTNPHNPSGALTTAAEMDQVIRAAADLDVQLLIDEAFIDFAPSETMTAVAARTNRLVVIRSLTKFYGMPALRVGYCVSRPEAATQVAAQIPPWPITTLAASAAVAALRDDEYAFRTLRAVASDRRHLREQLAEIGLETFPSAGNFLLLRLPARGPDSTCLRTHLIRSHGIVVRDCRSFDCMADGRFVRVAVRTRNDNVRLVDAIRSALHGDLRC